MAKKSYKQKTEITCGPAVMHLILKKLKLKPLLSEKHLVKLMFTNKKIGTKDAQFPRIAEKFKLDYIVGRKNSTIPELKTALKSKFHVIVCYYIKAEKTGHYAIVNKIDKKYIHLEDPYFGNIKYSLNYFKKIWHGSRTYKGWYIGIKR